MGRHKKFNEKSKVACIRVPTSLIDNLPENVKIGDYLLSLIDDENIITLNQNNITEKQKKAIKNVCKLFNTALDIPKFLNLITDEISESITILETI